MGVHYAAAKAGVIALTKNGYVTGQTIGVNGGLSM